jgi:DNA primase
MNLIYFQARRRPGSGVEPKYKNPAGEKQNIILNKDRFRNDRCIIVTEGLLDAFMIGPQGTTCLGKELSIDFVKKLKKYTHESIILAFDNDEPGQISMKKIMKSDISKMVKYFIMPKAYDSKDINSLRCDYNIKDMYSFVVENSYELHTALTRLKFSM